MIFKLGNYTYKVTFAHIKPRPKQGQYKMVTMCNVWKYNPIPYGESIEGTDSKDWLNLNYGMAKCGLKDNFCKETGRKIALTRALRYFDDKEIRTAIWNAYFVRDNKGITKEIREMASNAGYDLDNKECPHTYISEEVHVFCDKCGKEVDV
jgi:hypothetical protein